MDILKIISRLMDYPTPTLFDHRDQILDMIEADTLLPEIEKRQLLSFATRRLTGELLDWQADYDGLFERGRSLSLLIYEHLHGESRDRGQAMVNLLAQYRAAGLDISVKELPDYLPLFLEFLSTQGAENAKGWLQDIAPVLAVLCVRLQKRDSDYEALFSALLRVSSADIDLEQVREQIKDEQRDDTQKALDKVWEEEAVTFGADAQNSGCGTAVTRPTANQRRDQNVPIQFFDDPIQSQSGQAMRS
ncbi:nitrate reductase molybdenum cofactor assembly chaperone [Aestuariibacter halophilus]|uniref:Nitrate reductase molybdenum cofactor assembly chaperone n=1 Tax=Fluctibacter halophilus TaxID=226011 RepID=A0ABS8G5W0_9ALTE|nr:nitrate reductase molybdenum cofactor assembly chaperone [Aestuariibacter halophilus]MCC2615069.1 nitrate reductase molybdenum cofactor assembly chaperone [Aestuariibacter halophilus]